MAERVTWRSRPAPATPKCRFHEGGDDHDRRPREGLTQDQHHAADELSRAVEVLYAGWLAIDDCFLHRWSRLHGPVGLGGHNSAQLPLSVIADGTQPR
jgi:hypothetical protein